MHIKMKNWIFILIALLISCDTRQTSTENNQINEDESAFDKYADKIKLISLPMRLTCDEDLDNMVYNFPKDTITKYGRENSRVYGKLLETENYTAIIYLYPADIQLPIIQTTDKKGNKISNLGLYERWCGEDEFGGGYSWAEITDDMEIILTDSATTYKRDSDGEIIDSTRQTEINKKVYFIDNNGQIKEEK